MPGPPPLHPSVRSRRRSSKATGFRIVAGIDGRAPAWPLGADIALTAEVEVLGKRIEALREEVGGATDGRMRARLNRELHRLEPQLATLVRRSELLTSAEQGLWTELWAMPQAVLWAESHAHRELAQYVRWKIRAEGGNLDAGKEARMLSDRLGLNPLALLRLRAEIEQVEKAQDEGAKRRATAGTKAIAKKKGADDPREYLSIVQQGEASTDRNENG